MSIIIDFGKVTDIKEYEQLLLPKLADKDIGILVLNAGMAEPGLIKNMTDETIQSMLAVNALHVVYCLKVLLSTLMDKRQTRSGVLMIGSSIRVFEPPGINLYSAGKNFVSFIG